VENVKKRDFWGDLAIDREIILKYIKEIGWDWT
jgi:hypothetical protein